MCQRTGHTVMALHGHSWSKICGDAAHEEELLVQSWFMGSTAQLSCSPQLKQLCRELCWQCRNSAHSGCSLRLACAPGCPLQWSHWCCSHLAAVTQGSLGISRCSVFAVSVVHMAGVTETTGKTKTHQQQSLLENFTREYWRILLY